MALRRRRRPRRHLRRRHGPDEGAPRACRAARISSSARRAGCATTSNAARSTCPRFGSWCSTRPTRCSTWASARSSRKSSTRPPTTAGPCCSRPPCRARSSRSPSATRRTRCASRRSATREGHADIAYQAVAVSPTDIEHAVVNLLRLHEAETAILFCATRDAVRRLHASLTERGFHAVALSGEHSQNERNQALQALRDQRARVCVATDVAARGIDLPSVSLVIHVELPRDAEALQHRSGRTGRAGRKGTAVLIVPFRRRRNVETMLRNARIEAEWIDPPRRRRRSAPRTASGCWPCSAAPVEPEEEDRAARRAADGQAVARGDCHGAGPLAAHRPAGAGGYPRVRRPRRSAASPGRAPGFEGSTWFRMNAGRRHNADPRWLLPLICRYGHVGRNDIGAIRVAANESYFEVTERAAPGFIKALRRATIAPEDEGLLIEQAEPRDAPPAAARSNRPISSRASGRWGGARIENREVSPSSCLTRRLPPAPAPPPAAPTARRRARLWPAVRHGCRARPPGRRRARRSGRRRRRSTGGGR